MKIVKDILFFDQVSFDCVTIPDNVQQTVHLSSKYDFQATTLQD